MTLRTSIRTRLTAVIIGLLTFGAACAAPAGASSTGSETVIACFHEGAHGFTGLRHPDQCDLKGYRGRGRRYVTIPIKGMRWGGWGSRRAQASMGEDRLNARAVRLFAYGKTRCVDGSVWYSRVVVVLPGPGRFFVLRLPSCVANRDWSLKADGGAKLPLPTFQPRRTAEASVSAFLQPAALLDLGVDGRRREVFVSRYGPTLTASVVARLCSVRQRGRPDLRGPAPPPAGAEPDS